MREPKYSAQLIPTTPITAQNITQIHRLRGIRPISNDGVMLAQNAKGKPQRWRTTAPLTM
jgi:hypothetical protein